MTEHVTLSTEPDLPKPVPGPLGRLARVAYRRRGRVLVAWLVALVAAVALSISFGGEFKADYSAPGSDSKQAQKLLAERFAAQSGATVTVVVRAGDGGSGIQGAKSDVQALLAKLATAPHVAGVADPFSKPGGISADGRTAVAD